MVSDDGAAVVSSLDKAVVRDVHFLLDRGIPFERISSIRPHGLTETQVEEVAKAWLASGEQGSNEQRLDVATCISKQSRSLAESKSFLEKIVQDLEEGAPEELKDPVTYAVMSDPVVVSSGLILDRSTVLDASGALRISRCPITREQLRPEVYPILKLKHRLVEFAKTRITAIFHVVRVAMAEDCEDQEPDYAIANKVLDIGIDFLKAVAGTTYAQDNLEFNRLRIKILDFKQESALPVWVAAYQDLFECSKIVCGESGIQDSVPEMEGRFLSQADTTLRTLPHDPNASEQWLQALGRLLQQASASPTNRFALGAAQPMSSETLLKITETLLRIAKSCGDASRLSSARSACYFALRKVKAEPERIDRFLKEENLAEAHMLNMFHTDTRKLCQIARKKDSTSTDDFQFLVGCQLPAELPIQSFSVKCSWHDKGEGNEKSCMRIRLSRPRPASLFDGWWTMHWISGDWRQVQVHRGFFAIFGNLYKLDVHQNGRVSFKWADGTLHSLVQRDRGILVWATNSSDPNYKSILWTKMRPGLFTRYPPLHFVSRGANNHYYCSRKYRYFDAPKRWCYVRGLPVSRGNCHCNGVCGPGNGCQCGPCYIRTHRLAEDTIIEQEFAFGDLEPNGKAEVEKVFSKTDDLFAMAKPGDILEFEYKVGGGGEKRSLDIKDFVVAVTSPPPAEGPEDNSVFNEVTLPPPWLAPFLFEGSTGPQPREVHYTEGDGDIICFKLEDSGLVKYVNGNRQVGVDRQGNSGIVTALVWCETRLVDQRDGGGTVPREVLPALATLANRAGVDHNLPSSDYDAASGTPAS